MSRYVFTTTALMMALSLIACDRTASPSPTSMADAPTTTSSSELTPQENAASAMPRDADVNPTEIAALLDTFEQPGARMELGSDAWRERLDKQEFYVLRESGTERAFTGDLLENKKEGIYTCAGCGAPLFSSHSKFKSGTGWPSFYQPIQAGRVDEDRDSTLGMVRTEVHCAKCDGHLGHVFNDGPAPTNLRYCINAVSMNFTPLEATP